MEVTIQRQPRLASVCVPADKEGLRLTSGGRLKPVARPAVWQLKSDAFLLASAGRIGHVATHPSIVRGGRTMGLGGPSPQSCRERFLGETARLFPVFEPLVLLAAACALCRRQGA
jgi:hypothetical protein